MTGEREQSMSTSTQTVPTRERRVSFAAVAAIVVSVGLGAVGGSVITRAVDSAEGTTAPPAATGWDMQKLEAMQGRERAEAIRLMGRSAP
jgi:hypothetical protein